MGGGGCGGGDGGGWGGGHALGGGGGPRSGGSAGEGGLEGLEDVSVGEAMSDLEMGLPSGATLLLLYFTAIYVVGAVVVLDTHYMYAD